MGQAQKLFHSMNHPWKVLHFMFITFSTGCHELKKQTKTSLLILRVNKKMTNENENEFSYILKIKIQIYRKSCLYTCMCTLHPPNPHPHIIYSTGSRKRLGYLVATNWTLEKALHKISCN